ncbi:ATP-dependent DNA helicase UvrD [Plasmodium sp. gorilla clade G3]|nr:ATP-dependent DNA helicase UvrD [Plasmodium sp. gorilla clade G3]
MNEDERGKNISSASLEMKKKKSNSTDILKNILFNNLSEEQQKIVEVPMNVNLCIIACPGSGKTSTLTARIIKSIIEEKKSIVCITFTNYAASDLKDKIMKKINCLIDICVDNNINEKLFNIKNSNNLSLKNKCTLNNTMNKSKFKVLNTVVFIGTIHSFCRYILYKYKGTFKILTDFINTNIIKLAFNNFYSSLMSKTKSTQSGFGNVFDKKNNKGSTENKDTDNIHMDYNNDHHNNNNDNLHNNNDNLHNNNDNLHNNNDNLHNNNDNLHNNNDNHNNNNNNNNHHNNDKSGNDNEPKCISSQLAYFFNCMKNAEIKEEEEKEYYEDEQDIQNDSLNDEDDDDDEFYNYLYNFKHCNETINDYFENEQVQSILKKKNIIFLKKKIKLMKYVELYNIQIEINDIEKMFYEEYKKIFKKAKNIYYDFDDLLIETYRLMKYNTDIRNKILEEWHYVFCDEFQDTNTTQFNILQFFANNNIPSTYDQSIDIPRNLENKEINDNHNISISTYESKHYNHTVQNFFNENKIDQKVCNQIYFDKHCNNILMENNNEQSRDEQFEEKNVWINQQTMKRQPLLSNKLEEMSSSASSTYSYLNIEKKQKNYPPNEMNNNKNNNKNNNNYNNNNKNNNNNNNNKYNNNNNNKYNNNNNNKYNNNNYQKLNIEKEKNFFNNTCKKKIQYLNLKDRSLTVIGDDDQSIYSFRGAHINVFYKFLKDCNCLLFKLNNNFRSTREIVRVSQNLIINNKTCRIQKQLYTNNIQGSKIQFHAFKTPSDEISYILSEIIYLKNIYNYKYGDFVILCRTNKTLKETLKNIHNIDIKKKAYKYLMNKFLNDKQNHLIKENICNKKLIENNNTNDIYNNSYIINDEINKYKNNEKYDENIKQTNNIFNIDTFKIPIKELNKKKSFFGSKEIIELITFLRFLLNVDDNIIFKKAFKIIKNMKNTKQIIDKLINCQTNQHLSNILFEHSHDIVQIKTQKNTIHKTERINNDMLSLFKCVKSITHLFILYKRQTINKESLRVLDIFTEKELKNIVDFFFCINYFLKFAAHINSVYHLVIEVFKKTNFLKRLQAKIQKKTDEENKENKIMNETISQQRNVNIESDAILNKCSDQMKGNNYISDNEQNKMKLINKKPTDEHKHSCSQQVIEKRAKQDNHNNNKDNIYDEASFTNNLCTTEETNATYVEKKKGNIKKRIFGEFIEKYKDRKKYMNSDNNESESESENENEKKKKKKKKRNDDNNNNQNDDNYKNHDDDNNNNQNDDNYKNHDDDNNNNQNGDNYKNHDDDNNNNQNGDNNNNQNNDNNNNNDIFDINIVNELNIKKDLELLFNIGDKDLKYNEIQNIFIFLEMTTDYKPNLLQQSCLDCLFCFLNDFKNNVHEKMLIEKVTLTTIHKAKGLEWKVVFIINVTEGEIPQTVDNKQDIIEERKIFYVGITRAKLLLYLLCSIQNNNSSEKNTVSRFINEMNI